MIKNYHMPTKIIMGEDCIKESAESFLGFGQKALVVTGRHSAKLNGAEADVIQALTQVGIEYVIYNQVMSNPTVACVFEGAEFGRREAVDFVIAIGGGSPLDAAKAMALVIGSHLSPETLFSKNYTAALPLIAIPTTAGTGSEVTQYSIISSIQAETKIGIGTGLIFPKIAFLDAKYMKALSVVNTINTGIDALSHAVEGMMSVKSSKISDGLATKSIAMIITAIPNMLKALETGETKYFSQDIREELLYASTLAGMVIAQTGTTAVHAMGYSLTYFKEIDHGRANGLLLAAFMTFVEQENPDLIKKILKCMNLENIEDFTKLMNQLFGEKETITKDEMHCFSEKAIVTGNIANCVVKPNQEDILRMYEASFK